MATGQTNPWRQSGGLLCNERGGGGGPRHADRWRAHPSQHLVNGHPKRVGTLISHIKARCNPPLMSGRSPPMRGGGGDGHQVTVPPNPSSSVTKREIFFGASCFLCFLGQVTVPSIGEGGLQGVGGGGGATRLWILSREFCCHLHSNPPPVLRKRSTRAGRRRRGLRAGCDLRTQAHRALRQLPRQLLRHLPHAFSGKTVAAHRQDPHHKLHQAAGDPQIVVKEDAPEEWAEEAVDHGVREPPRPQTLLRGHLGHKETRVEFPPPL